VANALTLAYYNQKLSEDGYVILGENGVVSTSDTGENTAMDDALTATFGSLDGIAGLKYDGWKGVSSTATYANTNYYENEGILINEVNKLTDILADSLENITFEGGRYEAFLNEYNESSIEKTVSEIGADKIEFMFSANLGEPVKSLSKIISGGELSRFSLAMKCIIKNSDKTKTFVFDEIDTGIGGAVGSIIAKKISKIAKTNQVLCITHLAQIASFADSHYKITKFEDDKKTYTNVALLNPQEQITEITRMIGTMENEEYAKLHAVKLLEESLKYKEKLNNF